VHHLVAAGRAPDSDAVIEIATVFHPMGSNLPVATGRKGRLDDPELGLSFDNTGKNGHHRDFAWAA